MNKDHYEGFAEEWAQRMRDGKNVPHEYICKPALFKMTGDVSGKTVLCIGCGSGEECKSFFDAGASRVVGIDLSPSLIKIAKASYPEIDFYVMDMEQIDSTLGSFDIVVSNLVMHYVPSWLPTLMKMKDVLNTGGKIIISTNHPVRFGAEVKRQPDREVFVLGYIRYTQPGMMGDAIGDYLTERKINDSWFRGRFNVEYYHKPISSMFNEIIQSGLKIKEMAEPLPADWVSQREKSFYHIHTKIPLFLFFVLEN